MLIIYIFVEKQEILSKKCYFLTKIVRKINFRKAKKFFIFLLYFFWGKEYNMGVIKRKTQGLPLGYLE